MESVEKNVFSFFLNSIQTNIKCHFENKIKISSVQNQW